MARIDVIRAARSTAELDGVKLAVEWGAAPPLSREESDAIALRRAELQRGRA